MRNQNSKTSYQDLFDLGDKFESYRSQSHRTPSGTPKGYSEELKKQCCKFLRNGVSKKTLSEYLKISEATIYVWNRNYDEYVLLENNTLPEVKELKIIREKNGITNSQTQENEVAEIEFVSGVLLRLPCSKLDMNFLKILGEMT